MESDPGQVYRKKLARYGKYGAIERVLGMGGM
jgi:hypothetical protein